MPIMSIQEAKTQALKKRYKREFEPCWFQCYQVLVDHMLLLTEPEIKIFTQLLGIAKKQTTLRFTVSTTRLKRKTGLTRETVARSLARLAKFNMLRLEIVDQNQGMRLVELLDAYQRKSFTIELRLGSDEEDMPIPPALVLEPRKK